MDVTLAGKIDVKDATQDSRPRDPDLYGPLVIGVSHHHRLQESEELVLNFWMRDTLGHFGARFVWLKYLRRSNGSEHSIAPNHRVRSEHPQVSIPRFI